MAQPSPASAPGQRRRPPRDRGVIAGAAPPPASPRHATLWAALVYAVCTLALAYPALGGAFLVSPHSDQFIAGYAFREFAAAALRAGHGFPTWNPYLYGGLPYVAAMHGDIFYPTFLLRMIMRTDLAMTWGFALHIFLAGMFTYVFLRSWRLSFFAALLGGVAYMLGGQIASLVSPGHDGKLYVSALLPLTLWTLVRGIRDGRPWAWGAIALVVGLGTLTPHPQLLQYLLLTAGAWALYLAFGTTSDAAPLERPVALRRLGLALVAVAIGALIGAVQFLPVREYVPFSPRAGGRGYDYATSFSMPWEELLINTYLPQFTGMLDRYWGRNMIHLHSEYLGPVMLMLAAAGLVGPRRRSFRWFWIGAWIVSALWALGGNTPFYHLVYALVPGSKFFRAPSTIFYVTTFATAVLSALGVERVLSGQVGRRFPLWFAGAGLLLALLATSGGLTNLAQVIAAGIQGPGAEEFVAGNNGALVLGAWRTFLAVALGAGVIWSVASGKLSVRAAGWALVGVTALDLYSIARQYWIFSPRASVLYASDPAIDYLEAHADSGRVIAMELAAGASPNDPYISRGGQANGMMVHRVRSVYGYHGNELGRYQQLLGRPPGSMGYDERALLPILFSPGFWRHENVRYLYTNADTATIATLFAPLHLPALPTRLVGPVKDAAGSTVYLYQLPGANPIAWTASTFVRAPDEQALNAVLDPRFDPSRAAVVDTGAHAIAAPAVSTLPAPLAIPVTLSGYEPGRIRLKLAAPAPQGGAALVVSENYFPGWRATSDGRSLPLDRANFNLIGVQLPAGATSIDLSFDDPAYETGKAMTLLALAVSLIAIVAGVVIGRRAQPIAREADIA